MQTRERLRTAPVVGTDGSVITLFESNRFDNTLYMGVNEERIDGVERDAAVYLSPAQAEQLAFNLLRQAAYLKAVPR